jgi:hypothetical protein
MSELTPAAGDGTRAVDDGGADHDDRPGLFAAGSPARTAVAIVLAYVVVGALAGVVWEWVWTPPGQVVQQHQVFYTSYASLRGEFTGTGWYVVVAAVASALLALGSCLLARGRELLVLLCVIAGSAVAAALMWRVGTLLGPADPATLAHHTVARTPVEGQLTVAGKSPYLTWPIISLFVLAILYFSMPGQTRSPRHVEASSTVPGEAGTSPTSQG